MIFPTKPRWTPSGLIAMKVLSRLAAILCLKIKKKYQRCEIFELSKCSIRALFSHNLFQEEVFLTRIALWIMCRSTFESAAWHPRATRSHSRGLSDIQIGIRYPKWPFKNELRHFRAFRGRFFVSFSSSRFHSKKFLLLTHLIMINTLTRNVNICRIWVTSLSSRTI